MVVNERNLILLDRNCPLLEIIFIKLTQTISIQRKNYRDDNKEKIAIVNIYNCTGQLVATKQLSVNGLTQFEVQAQTGWYVVKVLINENLFGKKVFLY